MNSKLVCIAIASCLTLASCSSIPVLTQQTMPSVSREPCPPLPHLTSKDGQSPVTMGDLLQHDLAMTQQYTNCALKLQAAQENAKHPEK